jgi:CRISPR-associated protein Cas1
MNTPPGAVPDLVPARMVNAFCYCPRLFFLEWVDRQWMDNEETLEGSYVHRAVDRQEGAAPLPGEGELTAARSVELSSPTLGLAARIDLVEGTAPGHVRPVDTKRGRPPEGGGAWDTDEVQLCVQALLLREAGYTCREGIVYYAASRRRVTVPITEKLVERTHGVVAALREVAASEVPPPPLIHSPKCPRCSLVGICLPDELNALKARSELPPRRLLPVDEAAKPLYVTEPYAKVGIRDKRIEVRRDDETLASVRILDVSQLCVFGNTQVSSQLIRELMAREIPICWFSHGGWFAGICEGLPRRNVELRRRQVAHAHHRLKLAQAIVAGKIKNCRTLLRRNARRDVSNALASLRELAGEALVAPSVASLLGVEGAAARTYFGSFSAMLRPEVSLPGEPFSFEGRSRRPPRDPVNTLLSYVYALLVKDLTVVTRAVGMDPYIGFYHQPRFGRPALALDLAEEFRPLLGDSTVINLVNNGEIRSNHFMSRAGAIALTQDGRRAVLGAYERRLETQVRHPLFGYRVSYRRLLEVQPRLLAAFLMGETDRYQPFGTR